MFRISFRTFTFLLAIGSALLTVMPHETRAQLNLGDQQAPPAPTNLGGFALKQGVRIHWDNVNTPAVSAFIVYRLENYSPNTTLKTVGTVPYNPSTSKTVTYDDLTTEYAHTYTYFLTSKNRFGGMSNNSKMFTITTPAAPLPPSAKH
jgi:hypothetical protein